MSKKSGLADSPFFASPPKSDPVHSASTEAKKPKEKETKPTPPLVTKEQTSGNPEEEDKANNHTSMQARNNASMHASNQPFNQDTIIETIRKAVKDVGKDSATYRFTPEEKKALLELCFSYKMQGYKTSENEFIRIALNYLLEDQKQNGRNSVIQRVLDALNK